MKKNKGIAIVFSGGGAASSYGVGVWRAISEQGIVPDAVIGSSSGILNAAMVVQQVSPEEMARFYLRISPENLLGEHFTDSNLFTKKNIVKILVRIAKEGRYSNSRLIEYVNSIIDVDKIYASSMELIGITCTMPKLKPIIKEKSEVSKQDFVSFLVASASFPIFKPMELWNKKLVDGGFFDNCPVNEMIKRGYEKIYVINQHKVGRYHKLKKPNNSKIITICPSEQIGDVFDLRRNSIQKAIDLGYKDGKKILLLKKAEAK